MFQASPRWRSLGGFCRPFVTYVALGLLLHHAMRVVLLVVFRDQIGPWSELPALFATGLRFDLLLLSYVLLPGWLLVCLAPPRAEVAAKRLLLVYFATAFIGMTFLECATWPALREYGSRPEALFLEFLPHGREVVGMVLTGFLPELLLTLVVASLAAWVAVVRLRAAVQPAWPSWRRRLVVFPLGAALLFAAARSSVGHRPANLSSAAFSENHFHNELALSSSYTLLYAAYRLKHEARTERDYGTMPLAESLEIVKQASRISPEDFLSASTPPEDTLHRARPLADRAGRPPNVVIILLESFGAEFTGRLGGTGLTPNFDRLASRGLAFDRLFSTGTRTARGIEAVMAGFFPSSARSVMKLGLAQREFFTVADLFRRSGYHTHFVYGGEANFDEMKSFFAGNGVEHIWDQPVLQKKQHAVGVWGIHDEDLFLEAEAIFRREGDHPFFGLVLSTSNHSPFDYPPGFIQPDPGFPEASHENAIKYTDYALGRFFERAEASPYFQNTLFLVVADHGTRVSGDQLIPVFKFHIPGFILGPPSLVPKQTIECLASQVDLMPTLLALTGREWTHPMLGRNLLAVSEAERADPHRGRALLQYETHFGYWKDDEMVILRPGLPAAQFFVETVHSAGRTDFRLRGHPLDPDLVREALAHSLLPRQLYRERRYRGY